MLMAATLPNATAPGAFAQLASAYAAKHGVDKKDLKRAMAHVSVKSHANGALNPKAHLREEQWRKDGGKRPEADSDPVNYRIAKSWIDRLED